MPYEFKHTRRVEFAETDMAGIVHFSNFFRMMESTEHAYSHIKRLSPNLIIVCLDVDDIDGFQVLSMLKLDSETKGIPVVTCTVSASDEDTQDEALEPPDDVFCDAPAMAMN